MHFVDAGDLAELPPQPEGVPWPTETWPTGELDHRTGFDQLADEMIGYTERYGLTYALVAVQGGRLRYEHYGHELEHWDRPAETVGPTTRLLSWSMAKSITHAAVGIAVGEGLMDLDAPADVPEWTGDDPRRAITLDQLLCMRDGLEFWEDYDHGLEAHVVEMLFGDGQDDVAGFTAARPLAHPPGEIFNYSSGTTNLVARALGRAVGSGPADTERFFGQRLFEPIGMRSPELRFDEAGTFIGSSYVHATARDFARFGLLYLRGGEWDGIQIVPEGWVDHGRLPRSVDPTDGRQHGAHWWVMGDGFGSFWASGYDGQSILCVPRLDLVVVRLGKTPGDLAPALHEWRLRVPEAWSRALSRG